MNYADIKNYDIANGPGVRVSLFVSGCTHHCKGCFNPETWEFTYGNLFTEHSAAKILDYMKPDYICGLTVLGGEPFEHPNQTALVPFLKCVRETYPDKSIWVYTGYTFETDLLKTMADKWHETMEMLSYIDVLVDGEFIEEQKDIGLRFRGSANQRIILVPQSLKAGEAVLWDDSQLFTLEHIAKEF